MVFLSFELTFLAFQKFSFTAELFLKILYYNDLFSQIILPVAYDNDKTSKIVFPVRILGSPVLVCLQLTAV